MSRAILAPYVHHLETGSTLRWTGRVNQVVGNLVESTGPFCCVGESCEISSGKVPPTPARSSDFADRQCCPWLRISRAAFASGTKLLPGVRVLDSCGPRSAGSRHRHDRQSSGWKGEYRAVHSVPIDGSAPLPLDRVPIREPLSCGIRAIDGFITCGRGQRIGVFGGSGVGKSTLIGMMARGTAADLTILALVGERGREVGEFLEVLGEEGLRARWWLFLPPISHRCCACARHSGRPRSRSILRVWERTCF